MKTDDQNTETTPDEKPAPQEEQRQEELRQLYIEQQKRLSCPGCGEGVELFQGLS